MQNAEIRCACITKGIKLWQLAAALGYSETHFSRKLRRELPKEEKDRIMATIEKMDTKNQEVV